MFTTNTENFDSVQLTVALTVNAKTSFLLKMSSVTSARFRSGSEFHPSFLSDISFDVQEPPEEEEEEEDGKEVDFTGEDRGWKSILFLPFDSVWEHAMLMCVFLVLFITSFVATYTKERLLGMMDQRRFSLIIKINYLVLETVVDCLFLVDNFFVVCCKLTDNLNVPYMYIKRPNWLIVVDSTSSIPLAAVRATKGKMGKEEEFLWRIKHFLKVLRVVHYFHYHIGTIRLKRFTLTLTYYFSIVVLMFLMLHYVLFLHRCLYLNKECLHVDNLFNFCNSVGLLTYKQLCELAPNWTMLPIHLAFATFVHFFVVIPTTAQIIAANFAENNHQHAFKHKSTCAERAMERQNVPAAIRKSVNRSFEMCWLKRQGYTDEDLIPFINSLPPSLRVEISTDMNIVALKHCKLLQNMDLPFLRCLSQELRQLHLHPGEFVYQKGESKHAMCYIVSGIIQVISEEGDAAALSLSSGTCLGESTLVLRYDSTASVVCKEYCKLLTLRADDLAKMGRRFPKQVQRIRRVVHCRYATAKRMESFGRLLKRAVDVRRSKIKWINSTLRRLMDEEGSLVCQNVYLRDEGDAVSGEGCTATFLDLLALTSRVEMTADSVFYRRSFPPLLQPDSVVLQTWSFFLCMVTFFAFTLPPVYAFILPNAPGWFWLFMHAVTILYIVDIYVVATTVVRTKQGIICSIPEILAHRMALASFWCDVISAYPLQMHACVLISEKYRLYYSSLYLNRCLKIFAVARILEKPMKNYRVPLKYFKFFSLCLYCFFVCGAMYFSATCFNFECLIFVPLFYGTLYDSLRATAPLLFRLGKSFDGIFFDSSLSALYGFGGAISFVLTTFLLSFTSSIQMMSSYPHLRFVKMKLDLLETVAALKIGGNCRRRIFDYINTQWQNRSSEAIHNSDYFRDVPQSVRTLLKENVYVESVREIPLFKGLPEDVISSLCSIATVDVLPPKEVVCYDGDACERLYYILGGFVEVISSISKRREAVLGPKSTLCSVEAYLEIPNINAVITLTHCKLVSFSWLAVRKALFDEALSGHIFLDLKLQFLALTEKVSSETAYDLDVHDSRQSFKHFGYNLKIDSSEEYEYYVPFDRLGALSFVRLLLLRSTVLPFGTFIFVWETFRSVFALLSSILFLVNPILNCTDCYWEWFLLFLDLTVWCDIYLRFHVCYYDANGILVTHPLKTAAHYVKHGLFVDVCSVLPMKPFLPKASAYNTRTNTFLHVTRSLQLYRFFGLYGAIQEGLTAKKIVFTFKCFLILFLVVTTVSSFITNIYCDFHEDIADSWHYQKGVTCGEFSWFAFNPYRAPRSQLEVYLIGLYFTTAFVCNVRLDAVNFMPNMFNLTKYLFLVIFGYFSCILLMGKFAGVFLAPHSDLHRFQRGLVALRDFMRKERVLTFTQRQILDHYELQLKVKRGEGVHSVASSLHKILYTDVLFEVFGEVFKNYSVFGQHKNEFYRKLILQAVHQAFGSGIAICNVNDVTSLLYFVYRGSINVIAPDGSKLATLGPGSMFGNLDDYERVRQTVSIVADRTVEVFVIRTVEFYRILKSFPRVNKKFKYLTAIHIDYLSGRYDCEDLANSNTSRDITRGPVKVGSFDGNVLVLKIWKIFQLSVVCYCASILNTYLMAVMPTSPIFIAILYSCDILYLVDQFYVRLRTSFEDDNGNIIRNWSIIRNKLFTKRLPLAIAVLSSLPFDLILWLLPITKYRRYALLGWIRINRLLRLYHVLSFLSKAQKRLNANYILIKSLSLAAWTVFIIHVTCCVYIRISCLDSVLDCRAVYNPDADFNSKIFLYQVHLYAVAAISLGSFQGYYQPASYSAISFLTLVNLLAITLNAHLFGEITNFVLTNERLRFLYESSCRHLISFVERNEVSKQLRIKLWDYLSSSWKRQSGIGHPELLVEAPAPIKSKLLNYCYSHHIKKNVLFKKCHEDFVRQLVMAVRVDTHFPGDYVTLKGDVDERMYFIHEGSVLVLLEDSLRKEDIIGRLIIGQSFGILQGLFPMTPHVYCYRCVSKCDIVSLQRESWLYLLDYFPASKETIYRAAETYVGF